MLKRILLFIFIPMLAWVPMIIWVTSDLWVPRVFGNEIPYPGDGSPISTGITITLVILVVGVSFIAMVAEFSLSAFEKRRKRRLLRTGRPATAKVISISENSEGGTLKIDGKPLLYIVLEIDNGCGKNYVVQLDTLIPVEDIPRYQPGEIINVKIDKDDPKNIVIVP